MTDRVWQLLIDSFTQILVPGLLVTIPLTILSFIFGLIIAIGTALVQIAQIPILKQVARFYIWVVRGTPLLVQLYVIFFGLPSLGIVLDAFPSAVLVFSVNTGAYAAETIRASIESVPKGQLEAGYSVGMSFAQTMRRIILPQAFRVAFPPLSNTLIGLVKDTSLAANITVLEMFMATQQIAARTYEPFALYCEVALIYLFFSTILTKLQAYGEKKLAVY
ncbi:TPA: amino acid ABC transporter permease [Streptococcus suis]|uniref:amino acid ABC transporter permease n=1 Tax=Streptococcus suis TaxID=1307 RepID=UPI0003FB7F56|nr:amino acid ABC transporter permease [Streptococcus suis]MBY4985314.1 amino acid ABC transporter permease [Streptococcus suis]MBY5038436.1 amino acid ABC transporter permease [Streptococcus suis]MDW8682138.1 amino acid ABC transporter permease [Streptococcus suis]MDW8759148.1 amino acid ABC transporter permease [Streptococcus suis]NQJ68856.1 amino acid ABC transporter permease [Streptococcus suis]